MRIVSLYYRHRFPSEIISHCVWLYFRFSLSFRDVEETITEGPAIRPARSLPTGSRLLPTRTSRGTTSPTRTVPRGRRSTPRAHHQDHVPNGDRGAPVRETGRDGVREEDRHHLHRSAASVGVRDAVPVRDLRAVAAPDLSGRRGAHELLRLGRQPRLHRRGEAGRQHGPEPPLRAHAQS